MTTQEYYLVCLMEECAEVAQAASKALRFGLEDRNPSDPASLTNRENLILELNDFAGVVGMLETNGATRGWWHTKSQIDKIQKIKKWLDYSRKLGRISD